MQSCTCFLLLCILVQEINHRLHNYLYKILTCYSRWHSQFNYTLAHTLTHAHTHTSTHTHTHTRTHTCTHKHVPVFSLLFIASPNASIFGLPLTVVIMSQTVINASRVHFLLKHKCSFSFCCVGFLVLEMSLSSPSSMISLCRRSPTTASASTSLMNRPRNWFRIPSAEWRGKNHATPTRQYCSL